MVKVFKNWSLFSQTENKGGGEDESDEEDEAFEPSGTSASEEDSSDFTEDDSEDWDDEEEDSEGEMILTIINVFVRVGQLFSLAPPFRNRSLGHDLYGNVVVVYGKFKADWL